MRITGNNYNQQLSTPNNSQSEIRGRFELTATEISPSSSPTNATTSAPPSTPTRISTASPTNQSAAALQNARNIRVEVEPRTPPLRPQLTSPPPLMRQRQSPNIIQGTSSFNSVHPLLFPFAEQRNESRRVQSAISLIPQERRRAQLLLSNFLNGSTTSSRLTEPAQQSSYNPNPSALGPSMAHDANASSRGNSRLYATIGRPDRSERPFRRQTFANSSTFSQLDEDLLSQFRLSNLRHFARTLALARPPNPEPPEEDPIEILEEIQSWLALTTPGDLNQMQLLARELTSFISDNGLHRLISTQFPLELALDTNGNERSEMNVHQQECEENHIFPMDSFQDKPLR